MRAILLSLFLVSCGEPGPIESEKLPARVPAACVVAPGDTYTLTACPNGGALCTYHWPDGTHLASWGCSVEGVTCVQACEP